MLINVFKKTFFICLLFIFCCPLSLKAQEAAPFGLTWGASLKQIEELGVKLEPVEQAGDIYKTKKLPHNKEWAENYALLIDKKHGLVKIAAYGGDILNDKSGQMGRRIYYKLKTELEKEITLLNSTENGVDTEGLDIPVGMSFYACLENGPCQTWSSQYNSGDLNAELSLEGLAVDAGYVSVIYENSKLAKAMQGKNKATKSKSKSKTKSKGKAKSKKQK